MPIPFKADMCTVPDMESYFILYPIPGLDAANPENYYASRMIGSGTGKFDGISAAKAKRLLLESDRQVSDIAYQVGFKDANYFNRSFIQEFGMNATKMREVFI